MKDTIKHAGALIVVVLLVWLIGNFLVSIAGTTSQPGPQITDDGESLHASGAETATGTGTVTAYLPGGVNGVVVTLDVTAAATEVGDLLDVYVQTKADGTNWLDVCHFTQVLGNGGAKRYVDKIHATGAVTAFETGSALGAAAQRDIMGKQWRCRWTVTDAGADNASWTFSVYAQPM